MLNKISNKPFIFITTSFASGILISDFFKFSFYIYIVLFLLCLFIIIVTRFKLSVLIILLIIIFGILRLSLSSNYIDNHISKIVKNIGNEKIEIVGKIIEEPIKKSDKLKLTILLKKIEGINVKGKFYLFYKGWEKLKYGDVVSFRERLQKPMKNNNPFAFNYRDYLEDKGIYAYAFSYNTKIKILYSEKNFFKILIIQSRKWLRKRIEQLYADNKKSKKSEFLKAILLGEKQNLDNQLKDNFANSGLSHILAVSGLHTGVIALILLTIFQIIFRNKTLSRIFTIIILIYYVFLSHCAASVQRAVIMISLAMIASILQCKKDNINILFAAAFIILLINPKQIFSIGFQFSFLSVFAILIIYPIFSKILLPLKNKYKSIYWLINLMLISFVVQIILAPLTSHYFCKIAFGGILANIIAIPLISIILPLSLVTIFFQVHFINYYYTQINKLLIDILFYLSDFVSFKKILLFDFIYIKSWQVFSIYLLLIIFIILWEENEKVNKKFWKFLIFSVSIIFILVLPTYLYKHLFELTVLDVKTGDAIFIKTPSQKSILIDAGNKTKKIDYGKEVVLPFLLKKQIKTIDLFILTHPHADHIGGACYILDNIEVKKILMPECNYDSHLYENLKKKIKQKNIEVFYADTTIIFTDFPTIQLDLLYPYYGIQTNNINNYSIVLKCKYKDFSCILTGDAEQEVERWLCETYGETLDIDVLKVGHHGSKTSTTKDFLKYTTPELGVMSVGKYNKFGLPDEITSKKLSLYKVIILRTDNDGAVIFTTDGKNLRIKTIYSGKNIFIENI